LAHTKSAKKRIRQNEKRQLRNKAIRTYYRNRIKECRSAIASGNLEEAEKSFKRAMSAVARAVSKGVLHKNTARRYISRLNQQLNQLAKSDSAKAGQAG